MMKRNLASVSLARRALHAIIMLGLVLATPLALASTSGASGLIHAMSHADGQGMAADSEYALASCESAAPAQAGSHDADASGMHCVSCVLSCSASPFLATERGASSAETVPIPYGTLRNVVLIAAFNDAVFKPPRISG